MKARRPDVTTDKTMTIEGPRRRQMLMAFLPAPMLTARRQHARSPMRMPKLAALDSTPARRLNVAPATYRSRRAAEVVLPRLEAPAF